ncbi:MAG: hypothetical protein AAFR65_00450 [Pseudomonadota bacterium]
MRPNFYAIEAIAFGFRFAITGLPTALRLGWLPFLIVTAASVQMTSSFMQAGIDPMETVRSGFGAMMDGSADIEWEWQTEGDYEDLSATTSVWGLLALIGYVLFIPSVVALYRQAANVETRGGFLPVFGGPEWRFLASIFVMVFVAFLVMLALALVVLAGTFISEMLGIEAIAAVGGVFFFVGWLWFIVRFCLFQPYVAVTNSLSVPGALGMTGGRFWKLLGTIILVGLILVLVQIAASIVFGTAMAVSEFGSVAYTGVSVVAALIGALISIIGYGIFGRIVGDLLGTTEYDEPYTDEPFDDEGDDVLDELVADEELDTDYRAPAPRGEELGQMSYASGDGMMRRFAGEDAGAEPQSSFGAAAAEQPRPGRRSSIQFLRTRFR